MDKRTTPASRRAHEIYKDVLTRDVVSTLYFCEQPTATAKVLRKLLGGSMRSGVHVTTADDGIYVFIKKESREERLVALIRKMAMHVDDEALYEEALAIVGTI